MIKISSKEWRFVSLVGLILVFLIFFPKIVGIINIPQDKIYVGLEGANGGDRSFYYSQIEQVKDGHFLFKYLPTSEPHPRFMFDPFWLGVGLFAKFFSLSSIFAFQLAKLFLIPIFLMVSYYFVAFFFQDETRRKLCLIFLVFASGLGGFYLIGLDLPKNPDGIIDLSRHLVDKAGTFDLPIDLWVPEAIPFFSIHNSSHFTASLTLILLIFLFSLLAFETKQMKYSLFSGFSALFLFQFHPYHLPTVFGILGIFILSYIFIEKRINLNYLRHYFILLIFSLPPIIYHVWALSYVWVRKAHFLQNVLITPPLYSVLLGYGFLIIFASVGVFVIFKKKEKSQKDVFLLSWVFGQSLLIYSPLFRTQRKLTEGLFVVLVILTVLGLFYLKDWLNKQTIFQKYFKEVFTNKIFLFYLFFILFFWSNFMFVMGDLTLFLGNNSGWAYLEKDVYGAMIWLKENSREDSVIFTSIRTGNSLFAFSVRQVYLGHGHITANFKEKSVKAESFFKNSQDGEKITFLKENGIDYFFFGPEERKFVQFNPEEKDYFTKVFENSQVAIYKVND